MFRPSTLREILKLRERFNKLLPGSTQGEVYRTIAQEVDESEKTVAAKINMYGYYALFAEAVEKQEKERLVKS